MSDKDIKVKGQILGFIWQGDDKPIRASVVYDGHQGQLFYMEADTLTAQFVKKAAERGISLGEFVDEVNQQIQPSGTEIASWTFDELTEEQQKSINDTFFPNGEVPS